MVTRNKPGSQNWLPGTNLGAKIGYPKGVRKVPGKFIKSVWRVSRQFPQAVWLVSGHIWTVSGPCLDYIWNIKHVWRVSGPVWNVSGCVWMCLEHVWTVSRLCLEHVHTFCGPCSEHVWTVTGPWCPCLDHGLCMFCMDQFGPCLDRVLTLL